MDAVGRASGNLFNPRLSGGERFAANIFDPGGTHTTMRRAGEGEPTLAQERAEAAAEQAITRSEAFQKSLIPKPAPTPAPLPSATPTKVENVVSDQQRRRRIASMRYGLISTIKTSPRGITGRGSDLTSPVEKKKKLGE